MNTNKSNKNIVPTKKIIKSRTVKTRAPSRNSAIKQIYNRDYYGKDLLPTTNIIQYIDSTFNDYMSMKQEKSKLNLPAASFEDFFIVDDILKKKETIADIDTQINKQPNASLNKFLAYSLYYSEYKNWFNSPNKKMDISLLKNQSGKDLSRIGITLNNVKYNSLSGDNNSLKTDHFNVTLMNILSKFTVIDFDLLNKIDISMCQNILNFLIDLITLLIMKKIAPEKVIITKVEKNLSINLTKSQQNIIYSLKTKFYITKDGDVYNGEITCGEMELTFVIDLKKNSYNFSRFKCKYNAETCYQGEDVGSLQSNVSNQDNVPNVIANEENQGSSFLKYVIPAGLGVGVIATPFLLGALGGKNKKLKAKKVKTIKRKRKNKTRKKKYFYR
jgi:hypothetical protein